MMEDPRNPVQPISLADELTELIAKKKAENKLLRRLRDVASTPAPNFADQDFPDETDPDQ